MKKKKTCSLLDSQPSSVGGGVYCSMAMDLVVGQPTPVVSARVKKINCDCCARADEEYGNHLQLVTVLEFQIFIVCHMDGASTVGFLP